MPFTAEQYRNFTQQLKDNIDQEIDAFFAEREAPRNLPGSAVERAWAQAFLEDDEDIGELVLADTVETFDGCETEPDGKCPHGYSSPLLLLGLI